MSAAVARKKRQQGVLVGLVAVLVVAVFLVGPERLALGAFFHARHQASLVDAERAVAVGVVNEGAGVRSRLQATEADASSLATAVPDAPDTPGLVAAIDKAAAAAGVTVEGVTDVVATPVGNAVVTTTTTLPGAPAPGSVPSGLGIVSVTVQADGSAAAIEAFLAGLARLPRLVVVSSVDLDQGGPSAPAAGYAATVTGSAYYAASLPVPALAQAAPGS